MATLDTRSALLAEAETLIRTMGYAAFSYADLSERVGIRKASIHHHFATKESLGNALIDSYLKRFVAELDELAAEPINTKLKLLAYGDLFADSLRDGQMPLCGALAADAAYLPVSMQRRVSNSSRFISPGSTRSCVRASLSASSRPLLRRSGWLCFY